MTPTPEPEECDRCGHPSPVAELVTVTLPLPGAWGERSWCVECVESFRRWFYAAPAAPTPILIGRGRFCDHYLGREDGVQYLCSRGPGHVGQHHCEAAALSWSDGYGAIWNVYSGSGSRSGAHLVRVEDRVR